MRDLAEALDIKPASLYSHYRGKDEILWEIAQRCAGEFLAKITPIAAADTAPLYRLERMLQGHIEVMIANRTASAVFFREWKNLPEPRRSEFALLIARYEGLFLQVLQEGMDDGSLAPASTQLLMRSLLAATNWLPRWYHDEGALSLETIKQVLSHTLLFGLIRPSPPV